MEFELRQLIVMGLVALAVGGVGWAFIIPYMEGDFRSEARQKKLVGNVKAKPGDAGGRNTGTRNKQISETLKEIERKQKDQNRVSLEDRLSQAGLAWDRKKFFTISIVLAIVCGLLALFGSGNIFIAAGSVVIGGFGIPNWLLIFLRKRRLKQFLEEFPNAVDVIVRGVKSGLPLGDCIRIIGSEAAEPVRTEFRQIVESQSLGLSLAEATSLLYKRVPCSESNFFGIVIEIQSKSGGNLAEVLGNLSKVLRDRRKMRSKVQAMSMEAKASAGIIASLPFIVASLVYVTSPEYILLLFQTDTGKLVLVISGIWMMIGVGVMKKMIAFDI